MTPTRGPEKGIKIEVFLLMISSHRFSLAANLWTDLVVKFFIVCVYSGFISPAVAGGLMVMEYFGPIAPMSCSTFFTLSNPKLRNFNKISRSDEMFLLLILQRPFFGEKTGAKTEHSSEVRQCCMQINSSWKFRRGARRRANSFMSWQNLHNLCLRRAHKRILWRVLYLQYLWGFASLFASFSALLALLAFQVDDGGCF